MASRGKPPNRTANAASIEDVEILDGCQSFTSDTLEDARLSTDASSILLQRAGSYQCKLTKVEIE
jgi:hypothetical protein